MNVSQDSEGQQLAKRLVTMMLSDYNWMDIVNEAQDNEKHCCEALLFLTGLVSGFMDAEMWQQAILMKESEG